MRAKPKRIPEARGGLARVPIKARAANDPSAPPLNAWTLYEARKALWIAAHPGASPEEYSKAMQHIARQCGL